jgi:iron complex outermembrane receptor protein
MAGIMGIQGIGLRYAAIAALAGLTTVGYQAAAQDRGFADMSLEQLMSEPVTSVSKKTTKLGDSATAITVITQEELHRLGITSIPDALRLVPGMDVAQINSHEWAVSSRGFNSQFANKLLVLVDGRCVYDSGFGGVVWGVQDLMMEDIERIEVIRGPGGTLWGANAVDGVINIITKSAAETQGLLVSATGGTQDERSAATRYGGEFGADLSYRTYVKYSDQGGFVTPSGTNAPDSARRAQGGMRMDWSSADNDHLTLQGDYYGDDLTENVVLASLIPPYSEDLNLVDHDSGGNALGRWTHETVSGSSITVQSYFDYVHQEQAGASETEQTFDFDAQQRFALGGRNDVLWGAGYRRVTGQFGDSAFAAWNPDHYVDQLYSAFLQDDISIVPDRFRVTLGSKLEHNNYTGFEVQPSARLLWRATDNESVWAAVSRAVRTPSPTDLSTQTNLAVLPPASPMPEVLISSSGNPHLEAEELLAYELGYRAAVTHNLSLDVTTFFNRYERVIQPSLLTTRFGFVPPYGPGYLQFNTQFENSASGETYGVEVAARCNITDRWRVSAGYSWLGTRLEQTSPYLSGSPQQQAQLTSALSLPHCLEFNGAAFYVAGITPPYGLGSTEIPSYIRMDLGLVWRPTKSLELGLWARNLLDDRHAEFTSYKTSLITEIPRSVLARLIWTW